jgi:hypothetical protein
MKWNKTYFASAVSNLMNTFQVFSSPMVDLPVVQLSSSAFFINLFISFIPSPKPAYYSMTRAKKEEGEKEETHPCSSLLSGSIFSPNLALPFVYSCPFHTSVSSGNPPNFVRAACISLGVPSKNRPQPPRKRVSPVNTPFWLVFESSR